MTNSKTIKINPELFGIKKKKTQKNLTEKIKPKPNIDSNNLKRRLINKIKEHKSKNNNFLEQSEQIKSQNQSTDNNNLNEFEESIQYLTQLANTHRIKNSLTSSNNNNNNNDNNNTNNNNNNKTLKQLNSNPIDLVHLELPDDLKTNLPTISNNQLTAQIIRNKPNMKLNYISSNKQEPPYYGCLKNGNKPTYREWNKTQKNIQGLVIDNPLPDNIVNPREKKLQMLREKMKNTPNIPRQHIMPQQPVPIISPNVIKTPSIPSIPSIPLNTFSIDKEIEKPIERTINQSQGVNLDVKNNLTENKLKNKITKKTIRRKYTIGKSKKNRTMSILIKNTKTKKRILEAHKELKKKNINEIKNYLKEHGLIKAGTTAPVNVIRQMYEASILTGDITNKNNNILLHNFLADNEN